MAYSSTTVLALATATALVAPRVALADDDEPRSPGTAITLSMGGTCAAFAALALGVHNVENSHPGGWLLVGGSLLLPSLGEAYAGRPLTAGLGLRVAGAATLLFGFVDSYCNDSSCSSDTGHLLIGVGAVAVTAGIIYDIARAPGAARAYNARHREVHVVPTVVPRPSGPVIGLGVAARF